MARILFTIHLNGDRSGDQFELFIRWDRSEGVLQTQLLTK